MSALGIGVLKTYRIYSQMGIVGGLLINILIVISFIFTAFLMVFGYFKTNKNLKSLGELFGQTIGRWAKIIFDASFFFFILFAMTGLVSVIASTFYDIRTSTVHSILNITDPTSMQPEEIKTKYNLMALPVICILLLVLLLPKNISFLSMMGMVSFGVYCYLSVVIVV
jgi:amino acid permease